MPERSAIEMLATIEGRRHSLQVFVAGFVTLIGLVTLLSPIEPDSLELLPATVIYAISVGLVVAGLLVSVAAALPLKHLVPAMICELVGAASLVMFSVTISLAIWTMGDPGDYPGGLIWAGLAGAFSHRAWKVGNVLKIYIRRNAEVVDDH